jgi:hypothetical protein
VTSCPILDLIPVLEGLGTPRPTSVNKSLKDGLLLESGSSNTMALQENFRRIVEWTKLICQYVDVGADGGVDGGTA